MPVMVSSQPGDRPRSQRRRRSRIPKPGWTAGAADGSDNGLPQHGNTNSSSLMFGWQLIRAEVSQVVVCVKLGVQVESAPARCA